MLANPDKFQAIIMYKHGMNPINQHQLKFNQYEITSKNSVVSLGLEIDDKLSFGNHTNSLIKKAAGQLNYLFRKRN